MGSTRTLEIKNIDQMRDMLEIERTLQGFSGRQLSIEAGLSPNAYGRFRQPKAGRGITLSSLMALLNVLGLRLSIKKGQSD